MRCYKSVILFSLFLLLAAPLVARASGLSGWAWSENIGWISFNSSDTGASGGANYKVSIIENNGFFLDYAWSENIGWISFNRGETGAPPSDDICGDSGDNCIARAEPSGRLGESNVSIKGWARVLTYGSDGFWDGWLRFDHGQSGEVYIDKNWNLHGWAWGGEVVGWISFNSSDTGASGGATYNVKIIPDCDCSDCTDWTWAGCGKYGCLPEKKRQVRDCSVAPNPACCSEIGDCTYDANCYYAQFHTECDYKQGVCKLVLGSGSNECGEPKNPDHGLCEPMIWKWREIIPR